MIEEGGWSIKIYCFVQGLHISCHEGTTGESRQVQSKWCCKAKEKRLLAAKHATMASQVGPVLGHAWCWCGGIKCCATTRLSVSTTPPTQVGWSTSRCIDALELFSNNYLYAEVEADNIKRAWQQMTTMIIMEICLCLELYFHFDMSYQGFPEAHQKFSENETWVLFGFQHHKKNTFNGRGGESKNGAILSEWLAIWRKSSW